MNCKKCKGKCKLCNGTGNVYKSEHGPSWDRGDGVMYGSSSWTMSKCEHGCISTSRVIL